MLQSAMCRCFTYTYSINASSISWSDGLDNQRNNTLPLCQLRRIYSQLKNSYSTKRQSSIARLTKLSENMQRSSPPESGPSRQASSMVAKSLGFAVRLGVSALKNVAGMLDEDYEDPVYLWIDTLCVPVEEEFRKLAISRMRKVYLDAYHTVVLDSTLQHFNAQDCPKEELALRIGVSGWMRRAWTLQEGALSGARLKFLFRDGLISLPLWEDMVSLDGVELSFPRLNAFLNMTKSYWSPKSA